MSTAPSKLLVNELWSIQTRVEYWTLIASSSQSRKLTLRTMTLDASLMLSPHPAIVAPALPRMDLFDATRSMPEQEMVPETRITAGPDADSALVSAEALLTVVGEALPPPVVPPPWVPQPTRPPGGGGGGGDEVEVGGRDVVVGGREVEVGGRLVDVGPVPRLQTVPLRLKLVGAGLAELFQVPLNPNVTLAPVATAPFQVSLVALMEEVPAGIRAPQAWLTVCPAANVHARVQPLSGSPMLLTVTLPVKPPGHWADTE